MQAILGKARLCDAKFRSGITIRRRKWRSSLLREVFERLSVGVIVCNRDAGVVEMNQTAQAIVGLDDGLVLRDGQLCTQRVFETTRLAKFIGATAARGKLDAAVRRMLVGRGDRRSAYVLTVAPLHGDRTLAMILVVDPERHFPSERDLIDLFGLSGAEGRLAAALIKGERLPEIADRFGLQITTLRTQLRSVLKKVGADRQSDLIRILTNAGIGSMSLSAGWLDFPLEVLQIPLSLAGV